MSNNNDNGPMGVGPADDGPEENEVLRAARMAVQSGDQRAARAVLESLIAHNVPECPFAAQDAEKLHSLNLRQSLTCASL